MNIVVKINRQGLLLMKSDEATGRWLELEQDKYAVSIHMYEYYCAGGECWKPAVPIAGRIFCTNSITYKISAAVLLLLFFLVIGVGWIR